MTDRNRLMLERAAQGGLCGRCRWARLIESHRGSLFVLCNHPELPKYPRVPVVACAGYQPPAERA